MTFLRRWIVAMGTVGTETGIRLDLYAKLQRLPMAFHDGWQSGQLLSRMMSDLSTTRRFLGFGLLFIIMNIVQIVLVTALLLHMYWPLGLVVLASTVPITWSACATSGSTPGCPGRSRTRPATSPRRSRRARTGCG